MKNQNNDMTMPIRPLGLILPGALIIIALIFSFGILNRRDSYSSSSHSFQSVAVTNIIPAVENKTIKEIPEPALETSSPLAPFFEPSVLYWEEDIVRWANRHNMDPNMVATIMLIESCGDPNAVSRSGAMGLFQVMPFHFKPGEDGFDPNTNSLRGMNYLAERLIQTDGEIGHAFAGYNGGHVAAGSSWEKWPDEVQRYYRWTTGVYKEATEEADTSETLEQWLVAGGSSLCAGARQRLGLE